MHDYFYFLIFSEVSFVPYNVINFGEGSMAVEKNVYCAEVG
jgi:hypothetical protein